MFVTRKHGNDSFSKHRAGKSVSSRSASASKTKRSFKDTAALAHQAATASRRVEKSKNPTSPSSARYDWASRTLDDADNCSTLTSPIITLAVGSTERLFAAHADTLATSPFFAAIARGTYIESQTQRILLPEETPEVFSSVLEYLYKGDYYPRLMHNKRLGTWELEDAQGDGGIESTVWHEQAQMPLLKDTLIYCAAERYGLDELKRLALRKQGLQSGIQVGTILASARYAYANTPDNDSKLRAHYLALIIRSRGVFKRSGTMQLEMEKGGCLWFDLFVAMCNHMVSIELP